MPVDVPEEKVWTLPVRAPVRFKKQRDVSRPGKADASSKGAAAARRKKRG